MIEDNDILRDFLVEVMEELELDKRLHTDFWLLKKTEEIYESIY